MWILHATERIYTQYMASPGRCRAPGNISELPVVLS